MKKELFSSKERMTIIQGLSCESLPHVAQSLRLAKDDVNDTNKLVHKKVKKVTGLTNARAVQVLALAFATGEITQLDLRLFFATMGIDLNKLP